MTREIGNLIYITEGYPPTPGAASVISQCWVKYLRKLGWKVKVVAPFYLGGKTECSDPEVHWILWKVPFSLPSRISHTLHKNFSPFGRQYFWLEPAVEKIQEICRKEPCDLLLASLPPAFYIASRVNQTSHIPYTLIYWDTWTVNPGLKVFPFHLRWKKALKNAFVCSLEREILGNAHHIFFHGEQLKNLYLQNFCIPDHKATSIDIGFDPEVMETPPGISPAVAPPLTFIYSGSIPSAVSLPIRTLAGVLSELGQHERKNFKFYFRVYGNYSSLKKEILHYGLQETIQILSGWISAKESIAEVAGKHIALDLRSEDAYQVPSTKLYIYLGLGKPVLHIGSKDSETARILQLTRSGWTIQSGDRKGLRLLLLELLEKFLHQKPLVTPDFQMIQSFSLPVQCQKLSEILEHLVSCS